MIRRLPILALAITAAACDRAARAPTPPGYRWPDSLNYHIEYVSEAQRDRVPLQKYLETKSLKLFLRDGLYLGGQDSVLKTSQRPGEPVQLVTYAPEDTLAFYVRIGARGELSDVSWGCDPALPQCAMALPSSLMLELRRIVPRLPLWEAPSNAGWEDTLSFDDASRPGGTRGSSVTSYTGRRDTTIGGREYWLVGWRSNRQSFQRGAGAAGVVGERPVREDGVTLVDKALLLPVFSTWAGAVAAPPEMRSMGATGSGFRGRAYLAGSYFDSLYANPQHP